MVLGITFVAAILLIVAAVFSLNKLAEYDQRTDLGYHAPVVYYARCKVSKVWEDISMWAFVIGIIVAFVIAAYRVGGALIRLLFGG